jgi:hypothetical protein
VSAIVQDETGFVWLGTQDGLVRHDGHRMVVLRNDPDGATSLSASYIEQLLVARDGTLWVGTEGGGVNRYHPAACKGSTGSARDARGRAARDIDRYQAPVVVASIDVLGEPYDGDYALVSICSASTARPTPAVGDWSGEVVVYGRGGSRSRATVSSSPPMASSKRRRDQDGRSASGSSSRCCETRARNRSTTRCRG